MNTLIKSAQIVDGSGRAAYKGDILLQDDKISAIGNFPGKKADFAIDGLGYQVVPGFINVNTDSDHYLSIFSNPEQQDFLKQGVTTTLAGMCGSSLAPLMYGTLESIQKWTDISKANVNWHTMQEFLNSLEKVGLGVNFGTLIGHSTIRRALIGEDLRDLTDNELKVFEKLVRESIEEGAFGLSTGLGYVHSRNTPYEEIKRLAAIVAKYNGVYATHLRNEANEIVKSVEETIRLAKETGVKTLVSHFRPLNNYESSFEQALSLVEQEAEKLDFHFDGYPYEESVVPIYTLLPAWYQAGGVEKMLEIITDPANKEKIINDLPEIKEDAIKIASAPNAGYFVGKTLGEIAENQELELPEALLRIMSVTKLKAVVIYKNINKDLAVKSLMSKKALVASNSASLKDSPDVLKHERFYNTFPKFLEAAAQMNLISFEEAIKKLTSVPAAKFNLKNRGLIKEGYRADLVMLRDNEVDNVFVNGKLAFKDGQPQNILAGKILKHA